MKKKLRSEVCFGIKMNSEQVRWCFTSLGGKNIVENELNYSIFINQIITLFTFDNYVSLFDGMSTRGKKVLNYLKIFS